jgi:hypothetical protein
MRHFICAIAIIAGCSSEQANGGSNAAPVTGPVPTYHEDVAPILARSCASCHRPDGAGPFELRTYDQVKSMGEIVAHVTRERIMPPWLADNSGDCQTFQDANWLSDAEIETISRWAGGGMPEGDPTRTPSFDVHVDHLEDATHVLRVPEPYTPNTATDDDDYRCFVIDPGLTTDKFLVEYEVLAEHPEMVHHVIVYNPSSPEAVADARALDDSEPGLGYTCFGGPIVDATVAAAWAPGRARWAYPAGTGVPLKAGTPQVVQIHYNVHDQPYPDQSSVAFKLVDTVERELLPWFYANTELALPAGRDVATARLETSTSLYMDAADSPHYGAPMTLLGVGPHMHKLGRSERLELSKGDGSGTSCLMDVPRWDFNWQYAYFFETPVRVEPNDLLRMTCRYDTRTETETVFWGEGTDDEMCLVLMFSVFDDGKIPTTQ